MRPPSARPSSMGGMGSQSDHDNMCLALPRIMFEFLNGPRFIRIDAILNIDTELSNLDIELKE